MAEQPVLKASRSADGFVLSVQGRGTMRESLAAEAFASRVLEDGASTLRLDLSACEYLDSTFLGLLVSLHERFGGRKPAGRFAVLAPSAECQRLFGPSRLGNLLNVHAEPVQPLGEAMPLPAVDADARTVGRHVLECHRQLAGMGGEQADVFAAIVERLKRDLGDSQKAETSSL